MYVNDDCTRTSTINNNRMSRMRTDCHIPNNIKSNSTIVITNDRDVDIKRTTNINILSIITIKSNSNITCKHEY